MDGVARQVVAVLILARSVNHRVPHLPVLGVRKCEVDGFGRRVDQQQEIVVEDPASVGSGSRIASPL